MFIIICILLFSSVYGNEPIIKSLQTYSNKNVTDLPILRMNTNDKLKIEFDIESEKIPSFDIHFKFCNSNWEPYDNLLLEGIGENTSYNIDVEKLPITTQGADYFVKTSYPNESVVFKYSGKWKFFITDPFDEDYVYDSGKFYVVENLIKLKTDVQNWRREGKISANNAVDRVLNLKTNFTLTDSLVPFRVEHIEIVKNKEIEYPQIIPKDSFAKNKSYYWDGANDFEFIIRDLEPGNEYRQVNLRNRNKYQYPVTKAHFEGIERSRFYQLGNKDYNGGFRLLNRNNEYADYLITTFEFKPKDNIYEDIYIVGSFNNWEVSPDYKMDKEENLYSIHLELKRGVYDYQYVSGTESNSEVKNIDWRVFEGNYWDTQNSYTIFLYYKSPDKGEYDQIVGFKKIVR